ncbi:pilin [Nocardia pneumoniae]|uniref:pilin n=1 Tax=Nocardia pneumoniae TaxID=228601 RepID=UPI0002D491DE|nr:pilin [Nocardia pneumoniae]
MRMNRLFDTAPTPQRRARVVRVRRWATLPATACTIAVVLVVAASSAVASPPGPQVLAIASSLDQVLDNLRNWLIGILAALATVCFTVAGARYLIGAGDPAEMEKAKSAFRAACLGYALAMLAPVIVTVLKSIVGA